MPQIRSHCPRVYIVAHEENTDSLSDFLRQEGFDVEVVRGPYTEIQLRYSLQVRCFVNHANVWRKAAVSDSPVVVVEADFVPVRNFAQLPLPFPYSGDPGEARFGWLYSGGSILYGFDEYGFPHGHGNTTVAYTLTPSAAKAMLEYFEQEQEMAGEDAGAYRHIGNKFGVHLRWNKGILNHIPIYQYGEHGGRENPEHRVAGIRSWHQADVLWGRLAFLPIYANESNMRFRLIRTRAWIRGLLRVLLLRFFHPHRVNDDSSRGRIAMAGLAISRIFRLARPFTKALRRKSRLSAARPE